MPFLSEIKEIKARLKIKEIISRLKMISHIYQKIQIFLLNLSTIQGAEK